jgi:hypothetical protein
MILNYTGDGCITNPFTILVKELPNFGIDPPQVAFYFGGQLSITPTQFFRNL